MTLKLEELSKVFKISQKILKKFENHKAFEVISKEYTLKSLDSLFIYTINLLHVSRETYNIAFYDSPLRKISIRSSPGFKNQKKAITPSEKGFIFVPNNLTKDTTELQFKFEINYKVEDIIRDLVRTDYQIETSGKHGDTYWLHAQMKEYDEVDDLLKSLSLEDIPFKVNVGVHQDVKTKFPKRRQDELEIIGEWARTVERTEKTRLNLRHLKHKRGHRNEKEISDVLNDLQSIFSPEHFKQYVEVKNDFYYDKSIRGADFYEQIPFKTFPKWMWVI